VQKHTPAILGTQEAEAGEATLDKTSHKTLFKKKKKKKRAEGHASSGRAVP
jgi:hypothetical protein